MASLVDLQPIDENRASTSVNSIHSPSSATSPHVKHHPSATPLTPTPAPAPMSSTSNYLASVQQKALENYEAELKKVNNEWSKKLEILKKSYEDKIQNQEADFAWKYSAKETQIEKLNTENKNLGEKLRILEDQSKNYQSKMTRVQDDIDQLEGYTKQEMAKVKHLVRQNNHIKYNSGLEPYFVLVNYYLSF